MQVKFRNVTTEKRFWLQVNKDGPVHPVHGKCWIWTSSSHNGRGGYILIHGKQIRASRFSYELHFELIPVGKLVCHKCDNPQCVNPDHLFIGSHRDNTQDMVRKGRARGGCTGVNNSSTKHPELRQGGSNGNSTLTEDNVLKIRELRKTTNHTYKTLSILFGVSEITVNRIVNRRAWKHI